jgi:hypothetical protein
VLIELEIRRPNGTKTHVYGVDYEFAPRERDGPHVAEVTDPKAIEHFLAIDKFRTVDDLPPAKPPAPVVVMSAPDRDVPLPKRRGRPPRVKLEP